MYSYCTLQKEICQDLLQVDVPLQMLLNVLQSVCELGGNFYAKYVAILHLVCYKSCVSGHQKKFVYVPAMVA